MTYVLKTTEVSNYVLENTDFSVVDLEWNVDNTACLLVKSCDRFRYTEKLYSDVMRMGVDAIGDYIIRKAYEDFKLRKLQEK